MKNITIQQFLEQFPTDDACLDHIMRVRFGFNCKCPKCEQDTKFYRVRAERSYACQRCGWHVFPCAGTPFQDSRTKLTLWFYAIYLFSTSRHGVPAMELKRQLGVTYKCAWRIGQQIRKYMAKVDGNPTLGTPDKPVQADETYEGGKKKGKRGRGAEGKTILFGMLEQGGDIVTRVVASVRRVCLLPIIKETIAEGTTIHSDELRSYSTISEHGYAHKTVNHSKGEYATNGVHVNALEGFWARLKLSIRGTHVHVSSKHLAKYAGEFAYRYNRRHHPEKMWEELLACF